MELGAGYNRDFSEVNGVTLGGLLNLSGTQPDTSFGNRATLLSALYLYQIGQLPRAIGRGIYAGASLEFGRLDGNTEQAGGSSLRRANALLVGVDSLLGPLFLAYGRTQGGSQAVYLFVGRL